MSVESVSVSEANRSVVAALNINLQKNSRKSRTRTRGMSSDRDDEHKRITHDGQRGPEFRRFLRDFKAVTRGKFSKDDRYA